MKREGIVEIVPEPDPKTLPTAGVGMEAGTEEVVEKKTYPFQNFAILAALCSLIGFGILIARRKMM